VQPFEPDTDNADEGSEESVPYFEELTPSCRVCFSPFLTLGKMMNAPKQPTPEISELEKAKQLGAQRGDYTGQFTEEIDNADEIRAIENDPTLFPNSTRIYVQGEIYPEVKVPLREIRLSDTEHSDGTVEKNEPVRVYDCAGPWGDPDFKGDVTKGLPALRQQWIQDRGDVEEYSGRDVKPEDNGYLSEAHADKYNSLKNPKNKLKEYPGLKRQPLRAKGSAEGTDWHPVTQKWYADQGIITPEMEYIAIRENLGRKEEFQTIADKYPNLKDLPPEASDRIKQLCTTPERRRSILPNKFPEIEWSTSIPVRLGER